ncbi:tetratricopeptide repeat protein [Nocardia sp. alder85J]|uniref:tetratricopeptide repeat protein n=1 Tax=Nocardia sp. alder85J TaxID=2862949 RepID=UPI001CD7F5CE|nr:tetratricopeptide repeat protein [Nocardia sp. alder85J]MCX4094506.1 tetratricopeptide repeat protein [Nocardia sp. alder85J]
MTDPEFTPPPPADRRVPGFLGRILHHENTPAGTCFQATGGVLVTAAHVLREVDAGYPDAVVRVDALAGGLPVFEATVVRVDEIHDLAVLTSVVALPGSVAGWVATDVAELGTATVITGVSEVPDRHHEYRYLDAAGSWAGGTTRDEQVPLGRVKAESVMKGMSGSPVRRRSDDFVVGVVSERYNSADGWARDSVLVARIEDLQPLLEGIAGIEVTGPPPLTAAVDLTLTVTDTRVRLHGNGIDVTAPHQGVRPGLAGALTDVHRERARRGATSVVRTQVEQRQSEPALGAVSLRRAGMLAAESFLPPPIADTLAGLLTRATETHVPVRLGIEPGSYTGVPWEALPDPLSATPLALHPLITVYRRAAAAPVRSIPGPLAILVAIAAPTESGGPVLDYEHELRNVLKAVKGARYGDAQVRIVEFATTDAIHTELQQAPAHILHLSGHGSPGHLILETGTGAARPVTAKQLLDEAIPPGGMPPVISLAACYTDVAAEADAPSFATSLLTHGASVVIATETTVTDRYATSLFARVYQDLANQPVPDVVAAVTTARRTIHRQWSASPNPRDHLLAGLDEWSVVTVLTARPTVTVYDPAMPDTGDRHALSAAKTVPGLVQRETGDFVGRRRELRTLPDVLAGNRYAGIALHGIGGIGKTTLATQLLHRLHHSPLIVIATGELNPDTLLAALVTRIHRHHAIETGTVPDPRMSAALQYATRVDLPWAERLAVLREHVLDNVAVLMVLDNFEDNLTPDTCTLTDPSLAELLATWVTDPGRSRLLITCRYPITLPHEAHTRLLQHVVGPMTQAETFKLIWSLPALDRLDDTELDRVWRLVGGHPRSLEYLDALLNNRIARYSDITARLHTALAANPATRPALTASSLDAAVATAVTLIADDILLTDLFDRLTPAAQRLLIGAAVYREPVGHAGLLYQIGTDDPDAAWTPDRQQAGEQITTILTGHGIDPAAENFRLDQLPAEILTDITPALTEFNADPRPPVATGLDLSALVDELWSHSLISIDPDGQNGFVHRSTATALTGILTHYDRTSEHTTAHSRAAQYWVWRVEVWPQDRDADLHDRLEARHHYLTAGDIPAAITITAAICDRLDTIGAWDHEATLVRHTLTQLPPDSPDRAPWYHRLGIIAQALGHYNDAERRYQQALTHFEELGERAGTASSYGQLGILAQLRGDYDEAERRYQQVLTIFEELGNRAGTATSYHQLGILAQDRGDYAEAERRYQQSLTIKEELGDRAGTATSYGQLGILAQARGDYDEAERRYQQSLTLFEELGDRAGIAGSYHQLGMLAQLRGDYTEAERRYQQSLTIKEELGDRAGIASSYHQLGMLAQLRGDYTEAERRYQQSLTILQELGDRAGTATSYSAQGTLAAERDQLADAIPLHIQALLLRTQVGTPQVAIDLNALRRLRQQLGPQLFRTTVSELLSAEDIHQLEILLDSDQ